jgi:hypothetical protein
MAKRSKVERARRSIRVTVTTSPEARSFSMRKSSRRSARLAIPIPSVQLRCLRRARYLLHRWLRRSDRLPSFAVVRGAHERVTGTLLPRRGCWNEICALGNAVGPHSAWRPNSKVRFKLLRRRFLRRHKMARLARPLRLALFCDLRERPIEIMPKNAALILADACKVTSRTQSRQGAPATRPSSRRSSGQRLHVGPEEEVTYRPAGGGLKHPVLG